VSDLDFNALDEAKIRRAVLDGLHACLRDILLNQIQGASLHEVGPRALTLLFALEKEMLFENERRFPNLSKLSAFLGVTPASACKRFKAYKRWLDKLNSNPEGSEDSTE
jgi:hypothetical protein